MMAGRRIMPRAYTIRLMLPAMTRYRHIIDGMILYRPLPTLAKHTLQNASA